MKKILAILISVSVAASLCAIAANAGYAPAGDNRNVAVAYSADGKIDNKDVVQLFRYVSSL